jgi:formate--tetrahydrofolate ligase
MALPSDLEIAQGATLRPLHDVAADMGLGAEELRPYGDDVAKVKLSAVDALAGRPRAKYVLVTAITPTPLGEGKTTVTIGLGQAMSHIGRSVGRPAAATAKSCPWSG